MYIHSCIQQKFKKPPLLQLLGPTWMTLPPSLPSEAFLPGWLQSDNFLPGLHRQLQLMSYSAESNGLTVTVYVSGLVLTYGKWKVGRSVHSLAPGSWKSLRSKLSSLFPPLQPPTEMVMPKRWEKPRSLNHHLEEEYLPAWVHDMTK